MKIVISARGLGSILVAYWLKCCDMTAGCLVVDIFYCRDYLKGGSGYVPEMSAVKNINVNILDNTGVAF